MFFIFTAYLLAFLALGAVRFGSLNEVGRHDTLLDVFVFDFQCDFNSRCAVIFTTINGTWRFQLAVATLVAVHHLYDYQWHVTTANCQQDTKTDGRRTTDDGPK